MTRRTHSTKPTPCWGPGRRLRPSLGVRQGLLAGSGAVLAVTLALATPALAQSAAAVASGGDAAFQTTQRDPWVPPQQRRAATAAATGAATVPAAARAPTQGAALRAQAESRLRARFEAAAGGEGRRLTAGQAQAAGLGFVTLHFDRIDLRGQGSVSFEDLEVYLRNRAGRR